MPEFRVIFVRKVCVFKYARYERQEKLIIKENSNRRFHSGECRHTDRPLFIDECGHDVVGENLLCRFLQLLSRKLLYAAV
jgi:hypothetical protein